jgi:hypothetical protein
MLDKRVVVFHGQDRPDIQVRRDGDWHSGELRAWYQNHDGWDAMVEYSVGSDTTYLERVASDRIRPA